MKNLNEGTYEYHLAWFPDVKLPKTKGITLRADSNKEAIQKWENMIIESGDALPEPFEPHYMINKSL